MYTIKVDGLVYCFTMREKMEGFRAGYEAGKKTYMKKPEQPELGFKDCTFNLNISPENAKSFLDGVMEELTRKEDK
jgi:hypothetical protein